MPVPTFTPTNNIQGTEFSDLDLIGMNDSDAIAGRGGDDYINGGGGRDFLLGNDGNDTIDGGNQQDVLFGGRGNDMMVGGSGADWLNGDEGADTLRGGSGTDKFAFNANTAGVDGSDTIVDFAAGDTLLFGKYTGTNALVYVQNGANVEVYVDLGADATSDYLAVTVLNSNVASVSAATGFDI